MTADRSVLSSNLVPSGAAGKTVVRAWSGGRGRSRMEARLDAMAQRRGCDWTGGVQQPHQEASHEGHRVRRNRHHRRLVVEQAAEQGHEVTLLTRNRALVGTPDPRVHVVEGDVFDARAIAPVIAGHDAVVVTLGGGRKGGVRARGTAAIIEAMRATGVRRLVVLSLIGVGDSGSSSTSSGSG